MDRETIDEIRSLFETAENQCKSVEVVFSEGVVTPAINELRYCGKHLLDACLSEAPEEELRRAKAHCQRAIYDAAEVAAMASLKAFDEFRQRYRDIQIGTVIASYPDICKDFRELRRLTARPLEDDEKIEKYTALMNEAKNGMHHFETLDSLEEELKKAQNEKQKKQWAQRISIFLAGAGTAAAIASAFF